MQSLSTEDEPAEMKYTRIDFLRFDVTSIASKGNRLLHDKLAKLNANQGVDSDGVEKWSDWKQYPGLTPKTMESEEGIEMIAWLIHSFGPLVCYDTNPRDKYLSAMENKSLDWITADDFAFVFCQVQNSINRWHRLWKLIWDNKDMAPKDLKKEEANVEGAEYSAGTGISNAAAQTRYVRIMKLFQQTFKAGGDDSMNNKTRLLDALTSLATKEKKEKATHEEEESDEPPAKKARKSTEAADPYVANFYQDLWGSMTTSKDSRSPAIPPCDFGSYNGVHTTSV